MSKLRETPSKFTRKDHSTPPLTKFSHEASTANLAAEAMPHQDVLYWMVGSNAIDSLEGEGCYMLLCQW